MMARTSWCALLVLIADIGYKHGMFALMTILLACGPKKLEADPVAKSQAQAIFAKHVNAIGGEKPLLSHKSARIEGKIRRMDIQEEYRFITIKAAPDQLRTTVKTVSGDTAVQRGTDGRLFWIWSNGKYRKASDVERQAIKVQADFYSELNMNRQYSTVFEISDIQFGGRSCHAVLAQDKGGNMVEIYFDKEFGLKRGFSSWKPDKPEDKRWVRFGHYVDIKGTKIPFSIEEVQGSAQKLTLINSHKWDKPQKPIKAPKKLRRK